MGISSDITLIVGIICKVLVLGLAILIAVRSVFIHFFVPKRLWPFMCTFGRLQMKGRCRVKHQAHNQQKQEANRSTQGDMQLYRLSCSI
jgi:hypothetical protein